MSGRAVLPSLTARSGAFRTLLAPHGLPSIHKTETTTLLLFRVNGTVAGLYARIGHKLLIDDEAQDIAVQKRQAQRFAKTASSAVMLSRGKSHPQSGLYRSPRSKRFARA
jgi:hypothetical protein